MSNILDKLRNRNTVFSGTGKEFQDFYRKDFQDKYGNESVGLDYAKSYQYNPSLGERVLDALPIFGGKRKFDRVQEYVDKVHFNPTEMERRSRLLSEGSSIKGKLQRNMREINDRTVDDRFSVGSVSKATKDPKVFTASLGLESNDMVNYDRFISGGKAGHVVEENDMMARAIDPYNIAVPKQGKTVFGIPLGYGCKITSNVAEGGGSKIDPFINSDTLAEQVMQNKNLAVANSAFYNNKRHWDTKKDFNKNVEISNKRWSNSE